MSVLNQGRVQTTPQLSCELCRDRKVKCDKLQPCTNCTTAGVKCVSVHRLRRPRGRHTQRLQTSPSFNLPQNRLPGETNGDLYEQVRRLESLVQSMNSSRTAFSPSNSTVVNGNKRQEGPDDFWEDLVQEVEQLRDIVALKPGEADREISQAPDPDPLNHADIDGGLMIFGLSSSDSPSDSWQSEPSPLQWHQNQSSARLLCDIYLSQVDPIVKILHRPSLASWLIEGNSYLHYPAEHPSTNALKAAICYAAANSMTEEQSRAIFSIEKAVILKDCRRACESAIEKSDLLITQDISVLQAFVLYLVAKRTGEHNRAVWTLIATAVRVAKALRLHVVIPIGNSLCRTFFEQQMQKRLWMTLCVLDLQTSLSQASKPLISLEEVSDCLPLIKHINDCDFGPNTMKVVPDREKLTDVTFAHIKFHLSIFGRQIGRGKTPTSNIVGLQLDPDTTGQCSQQFETKALQLIRFCDPESSPYAWFTWHSTQLFVSGCRLSALRPLHKTKDLNPQAPPRMRDDTELLQQTLDALEKIKMMHTDPRAEGFRWMVTIQWHILAIAIAECYVCSDQVLVRRAWALVEFLYQKHESLLTQNSGGKLQGPLGKLMQRTREKLAVMLRNEPAEVYNENTHDITPRYAVNVSPKSYNEALRPQFYVSTETNIQSTNKISALESQSLPEALHGSGTTTDTVDPDFETDGSVWDQSWKLWEEFMQDVSFDDLNSPEGYFRV